MFSKNRIPRQCLQLLLRINGVGQVVMIKSAFLSQSYRHSAFTQVKDEQLEFMGEKYQVYKPGMSNISPGDQNLPSKDSNPAHWMTSVSLVGAT